MTSKVRLAVVGAGVMGANHARVARLLPGVDLVAIVDQDLDRARQLTGSSGILAVRSISEINVPIDAAVVAVPTAGHLTAATELVKRGVSVLVEKPLASNVAEAEDLVGSAESAGVILAVGHVERFNPAIYELPRLLGEPLHFEASRISPYTPRIGDGVIFDLMIHDIDIVCALVKPNAHVVDVSGVAQSVMGPTEDIAAVTMIFSTGETAVFNTSRLGQTKIRTLEVTQSDSALTVDLLRQDITVTRMSKHEYLSDDGMPRHRQSNVVEIPFLETRGEPLALELAHFVDCVLTRKTPLVDGAAGVRAVDLAQRATTAVRRSTKNH